MRPVIVIGGGGHAKVVIDMLRLRGRDIIGFVDPVSPPDLAYDFPPWLGDDDAVMTHRTAGIELANGIGSIASTKARRDIFERFQARGYRFTGITHPSAVIAHDAVMAEGVQIMAGAIVQSGVRIGANAILNTGCIADHDCWIGAHAHLAPRCVLSGNVQVEDDAHIGTAAAIIQGKRIGRGSIVGAGAVVIEDVPADTLVLGVPARIVRSLSAG